MRIKWTMQIAPGRRGETLTTREPCSGGDSTANVAKNHERKADAKSCAGYFLRQYSEITFREIQTARNTKRWHPGQPDYDYRARAETVYQMFNLGYSREWLTENFGVSVMTIDRDLAKIRKAKSTPLR